MFSPVQLGVKYLQYLLKASNRKGHGIHSPFVFNFIKNILNDNGAYLEYDRIEKIRNQLLHNRSVLVIDDFGAGSTVVKSNRRSVKEIAHSSLKPKKFSQLFYRVAKHYKPGTIVELGTSFGITTSYLASANAAAKVITMEGAGQVAGVATNTFLQLDLKNIELIRGNFDETLPVTLSSLPVIDLVFVDGNHRKDPTINYFKQLVAKANSNSIFIFDDIHWSMEMEEAWKIIKQHPSVTLTIDLFFIGIVFFRQEQKSIQHFTIKF